MILIVLKYLTPRGFRGITFFPFVIIANTKDKSNAVFINHEKIHIRQQIELLVLPFYVWYFFEFVIRWFKYRNKYQAYRNISFEQEAYANEDDLSYLKKRAFWKFCKYF